MTPANSTPARMFDLEGTLLGFIDDSRKPKSIILDVENEQMAIKLPKELRAYARSWLQIGDRLRCLGSSQVDFKAGVIKLRAYQVFRLGSAPETARPVAQSLDEAIALPQFTPNASTQASQKPAKILVCRKSGCQKRGGRKMVETLERILQAYQLQNQVEIRYTGCQKRCSKAPNLTVMPGKHCYDKINPKDIAALVEEHFCPPDSFSQNP